MVARVICESVKVKIQYLIRPTAALNCAPARFLALCRQAYTGVVIAPAQIKV